MENKPISYSSFAISDGDHRILRTCKNVNDLLILTNNALKYCIKSKQNSWPTMIKSCCYGAYRFGGINHYYVSPGVAEFCFESLRNGPPIDLPILDCEIRKYSEQMLSATYCGEHNGMSFCEIKSNQPSDWGEMLDYYSNQIPCKRAMAFHFPTAEKIRSIIVIPNFFWFDYSNPKYLIASARFALYNGEKSYVISKAGPHWIGGMFPETVTRGLLLYMDAFPDAITETKFERTGGHHVGKKFRIEQSAIAKEESERSVSPHYRRGHFRRLESERFVNTRGQTIFVRGCFVRGVAHQLNDDAPIEESKIPIIGRE